MLLKVINHLSSLVYPPLCLHCMEMMEQAGHCFCPTCSLLLDPLDPIGRCLYCFAPGQKVCIQCRKKAAALTQVAYVFDDIGPASTLVRRFKYGNQPFLASGLGAYLAAQFLRLDWPKPDLIVPVPISFTHWLPRGYNQSLLLAKSLGKLINCPVASVLKKKSGDYRQEGLSDQQREQFDGKSIQLTKSASFSDQRVLLVDDTIRTGKTLHRCGQVLLGGHPKEIYALAVCRDVR